MKILIAGGSGFIGQALVADRQQKDDQITIISRGCHKTTMDCITWKQLTVDKLSQYDVVVNLAGANIGEKRWSEKRKQEILSSRVQTTTQLAALCAELGEQSPDLLNASAIGVYGLQKTSNQLAPAMDENTMLAESKDFLSEVGQAWEQATNVAKQAGVRVVNMRFAVVLDKTGGVLKQLHLPYSLGLGGKVGSGVQAFSWVALKDLIRAIDFIISHKNLLGPINIVAPEVVMQQQFAKAYAEHLHRPCWVATPAFMLKLIFGQMADELLLNGQNVRAMRLLETGFEFHYPNLAQFFVDQQ